MERTLIIVKPDAVQRGLTGAIITRFEARGLKIIGLKLMQVDRALAEKHYDVHRERPFFAGLVEYIISAPVVVMALEGTDAISRGARDNRRDDARRSGARQHPRRLRSRDRAESGARIGQRRERRDRGGELFQRGRALRRLVARCGSLGV